MGPRGTARCAAARILEARRESGVTMTSRQPSLPFWLAHASLQLALRLWPKESRDWGHALAAELDEIEKPFEALRWAIGGFSLPGLAEAPGWLCPFLNFPSYRSQRRRSSQALSALHRGHPPGNRSGCLPSPKPRSHLYRARQLEWVSGIFERCPRLAKSGRSR